MICIGHVDAWEALDSRGHPTVGCRVELSDGAVGRSFVPTGASTGNFERADIRDGGERYGGLGVQRAVRLITQDWAVRLVGMQATAIEAALDEVPDAPSNVSLALSQATVKALAAAHRLPVWQYLAESTGSAPTLPTPMVNIFSGGRHAEGGLRVQDFLAIPLAATSMAEAVESVWRIRREAARLVAQRYGTLQSKLVADEGGLAIPGTDETEPLAMLAEAIDMSGVAAGIAIDVAATQLDDVEAFGQVLQEWVTTYPIVSVEDPAGDDDWAAWTVLKRRLESVQLVGDDLFATTAERVARGARLAAANAVLIKPNQAGTLARAYAAVEAARSCGFAQIVSARSGDTEDDLIADLAVGWGAGQIKIGSVHRSERLAKYNRLLEIEALHPQLPFCRWAPPPGAGQAEPGQARSVSRPGAESEEG